MGIKLRKPQSAGGDIGWTWDGRGVTASSFSQGPSLRRLPGHFVVMRNSVTHRSMTYISSKLPHTASCNSGSSKSKITWSSLKAWSTLSKLLAGHFSKFSTSWNPSPSKPSKPHSPKAAKPQQHLATGRSHSACHTDQNIAGTFSKHGR